SVRWGAEVGLDPSARSVRPGAQHRPAELPYAPQRWPMAHADHVLMDGRPVGFSSGTIYSAGFREFLSLGCLDLAAARLGTEVVVRWGDHGCPIKDIRATVARFPYLAEGRNSELDVAALPTR